MEKHIVLIPGTWARASYWEGLAGALEDLGYQVHTPEKRYHELSYEEVEGKIPSVSLGDYVDDFYKYSKNLDGEIIVLGHSLGGLIAQKVAQRLGPDGLILLGTAPSPDIFALYPAMVHAFYKHFIRWGFWKKPMPPYWHAFDKYVGVFQSQEKKKKDFADLVPESGWVYTQVAMPFLDKDKEAYVDRNRIICPVLVITSENDKIVNHKIGRDTAKAFKDSKLVYINESDHLYMSDNGLGKTVEAIKLWLNEENL